MVNTNLFNRVEYYLYYKDNVYNINESATWQSEFSNYKRHLVYSGIFTDTIDNIKFSRKGANILRDIYYESGGNAEVRLLKRVRHSITDEWFDSLNVYLNMTKYVDDGIYVSVGIDANTKLETKLRTNINKKIELNKKETLSGKPLLPVKSENLLLTGRDMLLVSKSVKQKVEQFTDVVNGEPENHLYEIYNQNVGPLNIAILTDVESQQHDNFHAQISETTNLGYNATYDYYFADKGINSPELMFFTDSDKQRDINVKIKHKQKLVIDWNITNLNKIYIDVYVYRYSNGLNFDYTSSEFLTHKVATLNTSDVNDRTVLIDIDADLNYSLNQGDSLRLAYAFYFIDNTITKHQAHIVGTTYYSTITVTEDSWYEQSISKMHMVYEVADYLIQFLTDGKFKSNFLGRIDIGYDNNGIGSFNGITSGMQIRQFSPTNKDYKPPTTSFKELYDSLNTSYGIGIDIEIINGFEILNIRSKDYYFQNFTSVDLGEVSHVKREVASEFYISNILVGYNKPSNDNKYDNNMGLDEYNTSSNYITPIDKINKQLKLKSPYRRDGYGIEIARRLSVEKYPTTDSKYDNDIFIHDLKKIGNNYVQRKWQDDFNEKPQNVYSPDTAVGLNFTPARIILQHSKYIKPCLRWNLNDKLKYVNSDGNSNLITKKNNIELKENNDININTLDSSKYLPMWVYIEKTVSEILLDKIKETTNNIPNKYGLFKYKYNGVIKFGYLYEIINNKTIKLLEIG